MISYRGHIVYVVGIEYPAIGKVTDVIAAAARVDIPTANLGVLKDGNCVSLSKYERAAIMEMNK